ncbi:MAG: ABC transporter ATP-binding protein [Nitrospirae bacterium]|nr:ABC transporter ATP-binding protein [Nitrospirota bacterium]
MVVLKGVKKSYGTGDGALEVLKGIDLDVKAGQYIAIMGPSGSGKSTLLHIIGCLDRPTSGTYHLGGLDVSQAAMDELAEIRNGKIGFVFQQFNLIARMPAWKNVELPLIYTAMPPPERKALATSMLRRVGLSHRYAHRPNELSGGEQQRVAIARALVNSPRLILADEPTGNLDSRSGADVISLFDELNAEGITIILITHDTGVAEKAHSIVTIRDGVFLRS